MFVKHQEHQVMFSKTPNKLFLLFRRFFSLGNKVAPFQHLTTTIYSMFIYNFVAKNSVFMAIILATQGREKHFIKTFRNTTISQFNIFVLFLSNFATILGEERKAHFIKFQGYKSSSIIFGNISINDVACSPPSSNSSQNLIAYQSNNNDLFHAFLACKHFPIKNFQKPLHFSSLKPLSV